MGNWTKAIISCCVFAVCIHSVTLQSDRYSPVLQFNIATSWLARLWGGRHACRLLEVSFDDASIRAVSANTSIVIPLAKVAILQQIPNMVWNSLQFTLRDGSEVRFGGFSDRAARRFVFAATLASLGSEAAELQRQFEAPGGREQYLTHRLFEKWMSFGGPITGQLTGEWYEPDLPTPPSKRLLILQDIVANGEAARSSRNRAYVAKQVTKHKDLFERLLGYPLNADQIDAILHDEDRALVVAGAGTGKTSTIVGKTMHILNEGLAKPEEILLLAFTRKAAQEMQERLEALSAKGINVKTFHALGSQTIANATGKAPTLSKLAEDEKALSATLRRFVDELLNEPGQQDSLIEFISYFRYPYHPPESFPSQHHYLQHIAGHSMRTLRDERVKSLEESVIANWLTLHGIRYQYERPYEHDTASVQYRQYLPDFYLPDYGVYIEHFGINKEGRPPPWFENPEKYLEGMKWKRQLHREKKTKLVETFSYFHREGRLLKELEKALVAMGVVIGTISPAELGPLLQQKPIMDPFVQLLSSFLSLYKGNAWTQAEVDARVAAANDERATRFLAVFVAVLSKYQRSLNDEKAIDFSDMITEAAGHIGAGRHAPGYRYILVDEFQDISRGRARLLTALLDQVPGSKLFAVGDDWQSIYRFTGSDIDLMTRFSDHFGFTRRTDLKETHRFNDKLLKASSKFIMSNPQQLKKDLVARRTSDLPAIEIVSVGQATKKDDKESDVNTDVLAFTRALRTIAQECREPSIDVLVLGRYHFVLDEYKLAKSPDPRLRLRYNSVHQAKGLEADYVVVLDVVGGRYGFPTEIVDDPLLDLVLAGRGPYPNAEERRLFYVAITRAKQKTFILTKDAERSVFVDELEQPSFKGLVVASGAATRMASCPTCKGGRFVKREGEWGAFWSCSNFPLCTSKARACPWCGVGAFVAGRNEYQCANSECKRTTPVCSQCKIGAMVPRQGKFGRFFGCTEWRSEGARCDYTRDRI